MKNGKPQAKDIPDRTALEAVKAIQHTAWPRLPGAIYATPVPPDGRPVSRWAIEKALPQWPAKVVFAKLVALADRDLLGGPGCCTCGCRGDFMVTAKGEEALR